MKLDFCGQQVTVEELHERIENLQGEMQGDGQSEEGEQKTDEEPETDKKKA